MSNDNNLRDEWDAMAEVTRRPVPIPAEPDEVAEILAEVERLRAIIGDQQILLEDHQMDTRHAFDEGGHAERASVVAALRRFEPGPMGLSLVDMASVANDIERGDHRREEEG
jgi:hypothetical protein